MADTRGTGMTGMTGMRTIDWGGVVRFTLPDRWAGRTEEHEGHAVAAFDAPDGAGTLRLVTDRWAAADGPGSAAVLLREVALRFVRPDDPRAGDRVVEDRPGGGLIATATLRADQDGRAEVHYLWLAGRETGGGAMAAMFSFVCPAERDGDERTVAALDAVDAAVRGAVLD